MGKVAVQEKTFPNKLLQKPTIIKNNITKDKYKSSNIQCIHVCSCLLMYININNISVITYVILLCS